MVDTLQLVKTVVADGNSATMDTGTLTGDLDVLRVVVQIEGGGSGGCRMKFNNRRTRLKHFSRSIMIRISWWQR